MGNFEINVVGEGPGPLRKALEIAFELNNGKSGVRHYTVTAGHGLVFHFCYPSELVSDRSAQTLPFALDAAGAADFASRWLAEVDYPREPDIDGDCKKGWRVYSEHHGHVGGFRTSVAAVQPVWAEYGK